ncbi:hypothetical protein [Streptomyces uncialis]|uniref:hypothetical protein n=1 Tax=Streptomyces uncialis TaxID=1048205 RepID=UPI0033D64952
MTQFTEQDIAPRRDEERPNNPVRWTDHDRGGHFTAIKAPDPLLQDMREFFADHRA